MNPARHICALGSPWTEATGMVLLSGSEPRREVSELAVTSCSAEMALEPLRKILGRVHEFHGEIANIHPDLIPVQYHIHAAMAAIEQAEKCYAKWRQQHR